MELLLYLAEFQNEQGPIDDPMEVDRLMQSPVEQSPASSISPQDNERSKDKIRDAEQTEKSEDLRS